MTPQEEKEIVIKAIENGNVQLSDNLTNFIEEGGEFFGSDHTLTKVWVNSFWGSWSKLSKQGEVLGNKGGMDIHWWSKSAGTGRIELVIDSRGNLTLESQIMGKEFVKKVLCKLIDDIPDEHWSDADHWKEKV